MYRKLTFVLSSAPITSSIPTSDTPYETQVTDVIHSLSRVSVFTKLVYAPYVKERYLWQWIKNDLAVVPLFKYNFLKVFHKKT